MEYEKTDINFLSHVPKHLRCEACLTKQCMRWRQEGRVEEVRSTPKFKSYGVNYANTTYHNYDTVLYQDDGSETTDQRNNTEEAQLVVGQITKWTIPRSSTRSTYVSINKLAYFDDLVKRRADATSIQPDMGPIPLDEVRLFIIGNPRTLPQHLAAPLPYSRGFRIPYRKCC